MNELWQKDTRHVRVLNINPMKVLKIQVLRGPNVWSNYQKRLIQVRLDLEEMEDFTTAEINGFSERIKTMFPKMVDRECSETGKGGFFKPILRGIRFGDVVEHIAIELQLLAGMQTSFHLARATGNKGIYNIVFSYLIEEAGLYAGESAVQITNALIKGEPYDLQQDIDRLREIYNSNRFGPSTQSIVDAAERRRIPWRSTEDSSVQFGYGINQKSIQATITCNTGLLAVESADDKENTKRLLADAKIPIPRGGVSKNLDGLKQIIYEMGYPVVVKPADGNQGKGVYIGVNNWEDAVAAFEGAQQYSQSVMVEEQVLGSDFRLLVINNQFVAAAKRIPAHIIGDGKSTVSELIEQENANPLRGNGHNNMLTRILIDEHSEMLLKAKGYTLNSGPNPDEIVYLKSTANLSTGGTAIDVTDEVHPENIFLAERVAKVIGLDVCGIDIVAPSLSGPVTKNRGAIIEVNAAPGFRMHLAPSEGKSRDVAMAVIDMLYPPGQPSSIPIIAITGTNGKTTTTRLLAHIARNKGYNVGCTTTDGIYINNFMIEEGDNTGPLSGNFILHDPTVEFAVLETARGGILRSGLCFDECDVALVTNIREDHLGLNDINTLEELANVKAVLPRSVKKNGWAVLNAEDEYCVKIASTLDCRVAFFSLDNSNSTIIEQIKKNQPVAVLEDNFITIIDRGEKIKIAPVSEVPVTFNGNAKFMVANVLAASLAGFVWGFSVEDLRISLRTFIPGATQTPGRLNQFEFADFSVLVDYAHNPHGYIAIEEYLATIPAKRRIGIISGIGDRRDEDIRECATIAGRMFDYIIIKQEHDLRGRTEENINAILIEGLRTSKQDIPYEIIPQETDAIRRALQIAEKGDQVVALCDGYQAVIEVIKAELAKQGSAKLKTHPKKIIPVIGPAIINNLKPKYHGRTA